MESTPRYNASIACREALMQISLRRILLALVASAFVAGISHPLAAQGAPPQTRAGQPYTIEYYYKCQWGHQAGVSRTLPQEPLPAAQEDSVHGPHSLGEDRVAGLPHHRGRRAGTTASPSATRTRPWPPPPTPTKRPSSRSSGPTRKLTRKKSSGGLRFCSGTWDLPVTDITPAK